MVKKPIVLCILDGWGISTNKEGNAIWQAKTPTMDFLLNKYPNSTLHASEELVGLPKGQMGNSEVGHLNLGAGRIVYTGLTLINKEIKDGTFKNRKEIQQVFELVKQRGTKLHFLSLISDGGVHSHYNHFIEFASIAHQQQQPYILHAFTDGRDVSPMSALNDMKKIDATLIATGGQLGVLSGRYFAMDRDQNWDRTLAVYGLMINGGKKQEGTCSEYIQKSYERDITDEFIPPTIFSNSKISEGDVVVFLNFRPDRAKQLSHLLAGSKGLYDFDDFVKVKDIALFTMMSYSKINCHCTIFPPFELPNTLGEVLEKNNLKQLRIAETEKYPHVTHFFDGGKDKEYAGMSKILIPSPKVKTYDLQPEMSAPTIKKTLLSKISEVDVVILNFANPDMVGHTGSLDATIKACEVVDEQLGDIYQHVMKLDGILIVVGDHGNAEKMIADLGKVHTAHTTNLVHFIICGDYKIREMGKLGDVAPTILYLLNIPKPIEMEGESMIV